jgi:raffinose/stachyose/melibiose transport system permease protein
MTRVRVRAWTVGIIAIIVSITVFLVPFVFVVLQASKSPADASTLAFSWPIHFQFLANLRAVLQTNGGIIWRAFVNSAILTVTSVTIMVTLAAMAGYVLARRKTKWNWVVNFFVLAGLIVPPAVVPTIWVLQHLRLFGTLPGMILIEATFGLSFSILLFRAFVGNIPRELDEAAVLDGAGPFTLFFRVVLPLLRPVVVTVAIVMGVAVFNDFAGPLYFLPGNEHATVQLTLFTFQSQNLSFYNLLFMDILLITIPPLIAYIFSNRQLVAGLTSGAIKG